MSFFFLRGCRFCFYFIFFAGYDCFFSSGNIRTIDCIENLSPLSLPSSYTAACRDKEAGGKGGAGRGRKDLGYKITSQWVSRGVSDGDRSKG